MDAIEPRVRRRGFFLHSSTDEIDTGEHENPEGFSVRIGFPRTSAPRHIIATAQTLKGGRSRTDASPNPIEEDRPAIRSGSVTGSRQRAHMPR